MRSARRRRSPRCPACRWWSAIRTRRRFRNLGFPIGGSLSRPDRGRRYFRAARFSFRAGRRCAGRSHAAQSQDSGWLQQSLLVLYYSVRARAQPQRSAGTGDRAGRAAWRRSIAKWCSAGSIWGAGAAILSRRRVRLVRLWCGGFLNETGVERLRLSSVEPMDFSDDLLGLMAESPRIAKHVHAPLQSGSGYGIAPDASQIPASALRGSDLQSSRIDAGLRRGRGRDDRFSGRDGRGI